MTQQEIYNLAIKLGVKSDLRGEKEVKKVLVREQKKYEKLEAQEKEFFDKERLENPYADTRILVPTNKKIKKILIGIDIGGQELLLADHLGDIDLVIAHHPAGKALAGFHNVMEMQIKVLERYGVPVNIAQGLLKTRISEVFRSVTPANHNRQTDIANHLQLGFMCLHTTCDNLVANFMTQQIKNKKFDTVAEVLEFLRTIPEYQEAAKLNAGPTLFAGSPDNFCGKIALTELTGGTEGSPEIYEKLAAVGIGTVIGMHMSEKHQKAAEKAHINAIIAGHISSDSIGINLFCDELEKRGIEIVPCSGLIRVSRDKKRKKKR
jgi:putative NIF3 family GTP cyclohydrolase 1 type 2